MKTNKRPPYSIYPHVSNEKVALRKIINSDINAIIEISFYDAIQAISLEQAIEMNSKIDNDYDNSNSIHWGIIDNQTNEIVGTCGYYRGFYKDQGELGCVLLPQYRGKGFMTDAMLLAIDFGFKNIGLKRIFAVTSKQNDKAIRLLERIGFKKNSELQENEVEYELIAAKRHY